MLGSEGQITGRWLQKTCDSDGEYCTWIWSDRSMDVTQCDGEPPRRLQTVSSRIAISAMVATAALGIIMYVDFSSFNLAPDFNPPIEHEMSTFLPLTPQCGVPIPKHRAQSRTRMEAV